MKNFIFNAEKEKIAILIIFITFFLNLQIRNIPMHKSGAQKRKEKRNAMTIKAEDYIDYFNWA